MVKALWEGDVEHAGEHWQFPAATSCPKPLQQPHPPIWIAARDPGTYALGFEGGLQHPILGPNPAICRGGEVQAVSSRMP